jgi:hypothetical protein
VDLPAELRARDRRVARVIDLSLLGCLVRIGAAPDTGAVVDLLVELPDGALRTKARVAETSVDGESPQEQPGCLAGLEFLSLGAVEQDRLRRFVASESRRGEGAHTPPA